ncbi:MAG: pectate lyase [Alistipes sp.]|nr:pectate lyase [Alistipes sp.]
MKQIIKRMLLLAAVAVLTACGGGGGEDITPTKLATPAPTIAISGSKATVTWGKVEQARAYFYELTKDGAEAGSGQLQLTTYSFTIEGRSAYSFRVRALADKSGMYLDSDYSTAVTAQLNQLSTPTAAVTTSSVTNTAAEVTWKAVDGAAAYHYQLLEGNSVVRESDVNGLKVQLTDLKENTNYKFQVKAIASDGRIDSNYSTAVTFKTFQLINLAVPADLKASPSGALAILSWGAVEHAAGYCYELYKEGQQTAVKSETITTTTATVAELAEGNYNFRVKAVGKADDAWTKESAFSQPCTFAITGAAAIDLGLPANENDGVIRAFPGAEGGGMYTTGGRGGRVIHVTNLNDSGSGSLRAAIEESGARTIVFDVCGTIQLKEELRIKNGDLTIAGQTAPGEGITLRDYSVVVSANNVIIRYMRFRMGDAAKHEGDAIWGRYQQDIILDHCSMSWSTDECASFYANKNFTMQWCLIGEALRESVHGKGSHGYGGIWGGKNASFHHNLLTSNDSRNARIDHPNVYGNYLSTHRGNVDYRNNLIYNWGGNSTYGGEGGWFNMVNNYYKPGPASKERKYFLDAYAIYDNVDKKYPRLYLTGNYHAGSYASSLNSDNWNGGIYWHNGSDVGDVAGVKKTAIQPIRKDDTKSCYTSTHAAADAYARTLDYAGASLKRDAVDTRLVGDARSGKATYTDGGNGSKNGIIDTQTAVGGWPTLSATSEEIARAKTDTDKDNIPDYYEGLLGLNPSAADATTKTLDPQGLYTNFEIYLHYLVKDITANQTAGGSYTKLE